MVFVPSPIWPSTFLPQQYSDLPVEIAHVWILPVDTIDHGPLAAWAGGATATMAVKANPRTPTSRMNSIRTTP